MENINIDDLSLDELYNLQSSVSERIKKIKEEKEKENQKKAEQHRIEYENKKNAYYKKLDDFTKDSSIILKELINKYEQICNLDISSLSQEEKLKLYVQKAYIENLLIGDSDQFVPGHNVGISSYPEDIHNITNNGLGYVYDGLFFYIRLEFNTNLINLCMKKIAKLKGKDDNFIIKIDNGYAKQLRRKAYFDSIDLLNLIDNIDEYFFLNDRIYRDENGNIKSRVYDSDFFTRPIMTKSEIEERKRREESFPLGKISIEEKNKINKYLCDKFNFVGSANDKYNFLVNIIERLFSNIPHKGFSESDLEEIKEFLRENNIIQILNKLIELNLNDRFTKYDVSYTINGRSHLDYFLERINKEKYLLDVNDTPDFMFEEEKEKYLNDFNLKSKGLK